MPGKNSHTNSKAKPDFTWSALPWIASFSFILLSISLIPLAGIQEDEALFSIPFFHPGGIEYSIPFHHHHIPFMVMSYVGTLKTLIYWPLVRWFGSGVWVVRLPVALFGAATVFLFYYLARSSGIPRPSFAAAVAALLLATDPTFLLTNTFDWGPVALEHVLLVAGCLLLLQFSSGASHWCLAAGFFCFGLALWNKALFIWALGGLVIATLLVCWDRLRPLLTRRNAVTAAAGFVLGAFPFLVYNLAHRNATLSENAHLDLDHMPNKWLQLEQAFDGGSMFGYMTGELSDPPLKAATSLKGRASDWIFRHLGEHRDTEFFDTIGVMCLLIPLWWPYRAARFSLVFLAVAWGQMALTLNAGAAAHHDVLLWPFPFLFAACVLAAIPWRWLGVTAAAGMILMHLLVVNQYIYQLERSGATGNYSDALFALEQSLPENRTIYAADWGIRVTSDLAHRGHLHIEAAMGPLQNPTPDPGQREQLARMLADPAALWVTHVPAHENFAGMGQNLEHAATSLGYHRDLLQTIDDSNGRPYFEIFRYVKAQP